MTQDQLVKALKDNRDAFESQLRQHQQVRRGSPGFGKKQIEDMIAGFADGQRSIVAMLAGMGEITVTE